MTIAEKISRLAERHGVIADPDDDVSVFVRAINRIEDIEPDDTVKLISQLCLKGVLTQEEGIQALFEHWDECDSASSRPKM